MKNVLDFIPTAQHAAIAAYTSTYDATADILSAIAALGSGELHFPAGKYVLDDTLIVPVGVHLVGEGRRDKWGNVNVGTIIQGGATLAGKRWTDITGSDPADDTPLIVAGGNNVWLREMTLLPGPNGRSVGFFVPCQKQCGFDGLDAFDFTDACVYLDATWSDRNSTMKALHPSVDPSTGMNEFKGTNFYIFGGGANGYGIKVQGTTRSGSAASEAAWPWGWGGASDLYFHQGRLGASGDNGGGFKHDGQLAGTAARVLQGATIRDVAFRLSGAGYYLNLDRSNRILVDGCYGETSGEGNPKIAVTSRTAGTIDALMRINDRLGAHVYVDGVFTGASGSNLPWEDTGRCMTVLRHNARWYTPNIEALPSDDPFKLTTFAANGAFEFLQDTGSSRAAMLKIFSSTIRPAVDGALSCGTSGFRWKFLAAQTATINTSDLREKDVIGTLADDAALMRVAARLANAGIFYRWNDAVEEKGDDARVHFGHGAQTVAEAFEAESLDPAAYAVYCKDYLFEDDGETPIMENGVHAYRLGLRTDLLNALLLAYYFKRQGDLEARLAALEKA